MPSFPHHHARSFYRASQRPLPLGQTKLSSNAGARMITSPIKPVKPWYSSSPTATLKEQIPPGITIDAKLHRYGARGTAKLLHGWRSKEVLEPLSTNRPVVPIDEFVTGLNGSPSFWPPEAFHPTGSRLRATMTRCPSSPIAISVEVPNACKSDNNVADHCQLHVNTQEKLQQQESQKLQRLYKLEQQVAREERLLNKRNLNEWQSRTLHFEPTSELKSSECRSLES